MVASCGDSSMGVSRLDAPVPVSPAIATAVVALIAAVPVIATGTSSFVQTWLVPAAGVSTTLAAGTLATGMLTSVGALMTGMATSATCCRDNAAAALQARPMAIEDWLAPGVRIEATVVAGTVVVPVAEVAEAVGVRTGSADAVIGGAVIVGLAATLAG